MIPPGPFAFQRQTWGGEGQRRSDANYQLHGATAERATFNLDSVRFYAAGSSFINCTFSQTPAVTKANLKEHNHMVTTGMFGWNERSTYRGCTFDHLDFRSRGGGMLLGDATFIGCTFSYCAVNHLSPTHVDFIDCTFIGTITSAMFWGDTPYRASNARRNTFSGNDFTRAKLRRVYFRTGIDLSTCRLPEGPEYLRVDGFLAKARRVRDEISSWPEAERQRAELFLEYHEEDRQDILFAWRGRHKDGEFNRLFALLEA